MRNELFLPGATLFFGMYFNLFSRFPKGIRRFLLVTPFVIVFSLALTQRWDALRWRYQSAIGIAASSVVASVASFYPHFLRSLSELVSDRRFAHRILADFSLDWGQARWYLDRYLEANPEAIVSPTVPVWGMTVVNPNELLGILNDPDDYQWLRRTSNPSTPSPMPT